MDADADEDADADADADAVADADAAPDVIGADCVFLFLPCILRCVLLGILLPNWFQNCSKFVPKIGSRMEPKWLLEATRGGPGSAQTAFGLLEASGAD